MTYLIIHNFFAQAYGSCAYGSSTYQTGTCGAAASSGSTGGLLTNTGFDIALAVTVACTLIFLALVIRFWKRPAKKSAAGTQ